MSEVCTVASLGMKNDNFWQAVILWIYSVPLYSDGLPNKPDNEEKGVPAIWKPMHAFLVPYGRSVLLECQAKGQQPMDIIWTKENEIIDDDDHFDIMELKTDNETVVSLLYLLKMSTIDSGIYVCSVSNVIGKAEENFTIYGFSDDVYVYPPTDKTFTRTGSVIGKSTSSQSSALDKNISIFSLLILTFIIVHK